MSIENKLYVPKGVKCIQCQGHDLVYWNETEDGVMFKCLDCYYVTPMSSERYNKIIDEVINNGKYINK